MLGLVTDEADKTGPPNTEELDDLIASVIAESRDAFKSDRWTLLPNDGTIVAAHAAAGLAHCCVLAEELVVAHARGQEMVGRLLARALFETWIVSYYIQLGGTDALTAIAGDYVYSRTSASVSLARHDEELAQRRKEARRRNRRIDKANRNIATWNDQHPHEPPKPLHQRLLEPVGVAAGVTADEWRSRLPNVTPSRLPLIEIVKRLAPITRARGYEETYEAAYHLAYRSLSSLGAHPSLFVLDSYLDNRHGRGLLLRIRAHAEVPSLFAVPNKEMSLLLLCGLSEAVFGARDVPHPIAQRVLRRFQPPTD